MVSSNKGFFSLTLLLLFVTAFTARNFTYTLTSYHKTATHHVPSGKPVVTSILSAGATQSLPDQLQDNDSDDVEVAYYTVASSRNTILPAPKHEFGEFAPYDSIYKVPLYDLYCNWKFHLI